MKLFCQEDGINTVYIQKKDLKCYPKFQTYITAELEHVKEDAFVSFRDIDIIDFFSQETHILNYQENISLSVSELQEKASRLLTEKDTIPIYFLYNQLEDISALRSFKLGKIDLDLPLIEDLDGPYFSNGSYKIRTLIDPFKVSIRKVTGEDFTKDEGIPQKIIDQATVYTKRKLGYEGDLTYCYSLVPNDTADAAILDIRFDNHEKLISEIGPKISPQTEIILPKPTAKQKIKEIFHTLISKKD